jgi:hypothetical protein
MTRGNITMKQYAIPENYIRRQQWTNFFIRHRRIGERLACWFVGWGNSLGRIESVYGIEDNAFAVYIKVWQINKDNSLTLIREGYNHESKDTLLSCLRKSPESHCTDYMPYLIGAALNPPAEIKGKIIPFPIQCNKKHNRTKTGGNNATGKRGIK